MNPLATILARKKISLPEMVAEISEETKPKPPIQPLAIHPCPTCSSPLFWTSTYRDGVIRCRECSPPPGQSLVRSWLLIVPRTRSANDADPTSEFQYEMLRADFTRLDQPNASLAGKLEAENHELARVLPDWHFPRWPDWSRRDGARTHLADPCTLAECTRCSSREFRDVEIHAGRSSRRECVRCGLTKGFPRWAGSDLIPLVEIPVKTNEIDPLDGLF